MADDRGADVSVVVCTIDRPAELSRCIDAIEQGATAPAEIVVVDRGGRAAAAVGGTARSRVQVVRSAEQGISRARNEGAACAGNQLLAFTDDDCVPDRDWLRALLGSCVAEVGAVTGPVLPLPSQKRRLVPVASRTSRKRRVFDASGAQMPWDLGTGGNLLVRRAVFESIGGFDPALGPGAPGRAAEDVDFLYRVVAAGHSIVYEPRAMVRHEMKTRLTRLRGRFAYGYGVGVFVGSRAAADVGLADAQRSYLRTQLLATGTGALRLRPREAAEALVTLVGFGWSRVASRRRRR